MTAVHETAYPRFKTNINAKDLENLYTPTRDEVSFAQKNTKGQLTKLCLLFTLKSFQNLGYFIPTIEMPELVLEHISNSLKINFNPEILRKYDKSRSRKYHVAAIRKYLNVNAYGKEARHVLFKTIEAAALTKDENIDLINIAIEELIRQNYELPVFKTLSRASEKIKLIIYRVYYKNIFNSLDEESKKGIDKLFEKENLKEKLDKLLENEESKGKIDETLEDESQYTLWNKVKQDPSSPTVRHLRELVDHLIWLKEQNISTKNLENIPYAKIRQFALEAKTLDASKIKRMEAFKKYALVVSLIYIQTSNTIDDLAEMLIKRMMHIHSKGKEALEKYRKDHLKITDSLVLTLKDVVAAYQKDGTKEEKFSAIEAILSTQSKELLENCEAHAAHSGNNYYQFLWTYYKSHRKILLDILKTVTMHSTNQDLSLEDALNFILANEKKKSDWLYTIKKENKGKKNEKKTQLLDLSWIPDSWLKIVTGKISRTEYPEKIDRRNFEVCLFTQIMWDLKAGDLYIDGGDKYSDFREQLVSWEDYNKNKALFGQQVNLPVESPDFIKSLQELMHKTISETDESFPENEYVKIVNHEPVINKLEKIEYPEQKKKIDALIAERLKPVNILDVITDTDYWLNWTKHFGLISGHDSKTEDTKARYLLATFCYGCNLGPTQTVRSLEELTRKQISWINQHHITEEKIEKCNEQIVNAFNTLELPKKWGNGKIASIDGTKRDLYERNIFSENHIRYGGYGGISLNLMSDTCMILFTHFIPCGAWEGTYLIDVLQGNKSDIQPETVHGDTQSQNAPIFGLSYLLGINVMPRIRNWKDLTLYRPDENKKYKHIDELFTDTIDWKLIETYFPDMLRVAISIKEGKIKPSTILKKLGTFTRKNKLYQAFRELGRVIRTVYLMKYMGKVELRSTIQSATNKSEGYNGFSKWIAFGNEGTIKENVRDEQRKMVKYNQLVASCLIFYNTCMLTHIIDDLRAEGHVIEEATLASLSPFITHHINRFGKYKLDLDRKPIDVKYDLEEVKTK